MENTMEELEYHNNSFFTCTEKDLGPKRDSLYIVIPILVIYVIIFVTGTIGNISTCIVISRNKAMHTATNYYLFSLAISDLLLLVSGLPQEIYLIWSRYPYVFGGVFCFIRGLSAETSANATVLTITAFTVERYLAICHPFLSHTMSKLSRAVKFILGIWLMAVCLAIPQAMQFGIVQGEGDDCAMCMLVAPIIQNSFELSTFLFFVAPMTLITVLYILIGVRLKSSRMMKRRSTNARIQSKSSKKVVKMLVSVVIAFFVCWAPFHTQRLYTIYSARGDHDHEAQQFYRNVYAVITYISGILFYMSATVNPILYNIMSVKFREAFKETFTRCCGLGHLQNTRPQRSYSVLSRSAQRGPDSTDSGKEDPTVHTHTTLTQKSSVESFNGALHSFSRRQKTSTSIRENGIEEENLQNNEWDESPPEAPAETQPDVNESTPRTPYMTIHIKNPTVTKFSKFWQYFECLAKRTLDDSKRLSAYYTSPQKEPNIILELEKTIKKESYPSLSTCDISNSSLRDVDSMAIEDELTAYMKEIKRRECCS